MKGLVNFFANKEPNVDDSRSLTSTETPMVKIYAKVAYLAVSFLLSFNKIIYGK